MRVDLGPIICNHTATWNGGTWLVQTMEGWDAAEMRLQTAPITAMDGVSLSSLLYGQRVLTLTGIAKCGTEANLWACYNGLLGLFAIPGTEVELRVYETVNKIVNVTRGGAPKLEYRGGTLTFMLPLIAKDPYKYAVSDTVVSVGASATVNTMPSGNAPVWPVVTSTAGTTLDVECTTTKTRVKASGLTAGSPANTFDCKKRTAYKGTTDIFGKLDLPSTSWLALAPGVSNAVKNNTANALTVTYRNAWV